MAFIRNNCSIAPLTWLKVGGIVKTLFIPKNLDEIKNFIIENKDPIIILGGVSNCLILDGYWDVSVLKTTFLTNINLLPNNQLEVECGTLDKLVSKWALDNNIGGLEFLDSIPGTIGGNILTNAGCYGCEIKDILIEAKCITKDGQIKILSCKDFEFSYRKGIIPNDILMIYSVILQGYLDSKENILEKMNNMAYKRNISQPIGIATCGSTFKNPIDKKAWQLIQQSGAHLLKVNNVSWSSIHCNFLYNQGKSANDIKKLINDTQQLVFNTTGILLELEIFILGNEN
jgi:UDP-N-acetylmuramate dehydrogenase